MYEAYKPVFNFQENCPRFLQFLDDTVQTKGVIDQIQEFLGYLFLKSSPIAKCLVLIGPESSGKSTLLGVIRAMLGPEKCAEVSFSEIENQFLRAELFDKVVNIDTDVDSKVFESPYFKSIISGDLTNAAIKRRRSFAFIPRCKLIFSINEIPRININNEGVYRRILPVQFKRVFMDSMERDSFLASKLMAEMSGIYMWALVGLSRLLENEQFTDCQETMNLIEAIKRLNNPVGVKCA